MFITDLKKNDVIGDFKTLHEFLVKRPFKNNLLRVQKINFYFDGYINLREVYQGNFVYLGHKTLFGVRYTKEEPIKIESKLLPEVRSEINFILKVVDNNDYILGFDNENNDYYFQYCDIEEKFIGSRYIEQPVLKRVSLDILDLNWLEKQLIQDKYQELQQSERKEKKERGCEIINKAMRDYWKG